MVMEDHEVAVEMKCVSELQSELGRRMGYVPGIMGDIGPAAGSNLSRNGYVPGGPSLQWSLPDLYWPHVSSHVRTL